MMARRAYNVGMVTRDLLTAEDLLKRQPPHKRSELIKGQLLVREPAGARHGAVANELAFRITSHVRAANLGRVYAAETGFKIESDPDSVRAPDVAFIRSERLAERDPVGFLGMAPDLVVEVVSRDDKPGEVLAKVGMWLSAGCRLVWVVDVERRVGRVYRFDGGVSILEAAGVLDGQDVLPGFSCPLNDIW